MFIHCESIKRVVHNFRHNFDKRWPIFKIISLLDSELNLQQNSVIIFPITPWVCSYIPCETKIFQKQQYFDRPISHTWQLGHWTIKYQLLPNGITILCFVSITITQNVQNVPPLHGHSQSWYRRQWRFAPGCFTRE